MDTALSEISAFLHTTVPFDQLPPEVIEKVIKQINICYVLTGKQLPPNDHQPGQLYIVRKGALSYSSRSGELLGKYGEGDVCTVFCNSSPEDWAFEVSTVEDCILYCLHYAHLAELLKDFPQVTNFLEHSAEQQLSSRMTQVNEEAVLASSIVNCEVSRFYNSPIASIEHHQAINKAAKIMAENSYSCLVVTEQGQPRGIVTDKDIVRRCVASDLSTEQSVSDIMSSNIITIDLNANAFEAVLMMTAKRIHHLPVTQSGELVGMVSMTDLINHEGQNALNITSMIHKAKSGPELFELGKLLPKLQQRMEKMGATADLVGKSISAITSSFTAKFIELFEQDNGSAPVPYAWLAAGSQARKEQLGHSDQDNALIISDQMKPEHDDWFARLASFVCDGLAQCGYVYCPGEIMATNKQWRQPQKVWQDYFDKWIDTPNPKALLNSSVFFDMDTVYGDPALLLEVRQNMLKKTAQNTLFIAHLSNNALGFRPPLGFFRDFVLISSGEHQQTMDLKRSGITPIVDLARIYALQQGINATNTVERIEQAAGTPALSKGSAASLIDAYQFLTTLRLQHQCNRLSKGEQPNNYLSPKALSKLEREHLKAAFKVIKTLQDVRQKTY